MPRHDSVSNALTQERLKDVLNYDPATGVWTWNKCLSPRVKAGSIAGRTDRDGYRDIGIDGRKYRCCRLAFLYMTGKWPKNLVDHKNLNKADDSWLNLREATASENEANKTCRGSIPFKGVDYINNKYRARIGKNRLYLGYFDTAEEAHSAYVAAANKTFGKFARIA